MGYYYFLERTSTWFCATEKALSPIRWQAVLDEHLNGPFEELMRVHRDEPEFGDHMVASQHTRSTRGCDPRPSGISFPHSTPIDMTGQIRNKTVYFVRHAESVENEKHRSIHRVLENLKSASLPDHDDVIKVVELLDMPSNIDTPVTPRGRRQIQNVAQQLQRDNFLEASQISLVAHSPLQRAQETSEGLLQCRAKHCQAPTVQRVVQLESLRERTPDEIWIPWRKAEYTARRRSFLMWLLEQPETVIAVVGHSEYFRSLLHLPFKFGHCDIWRAEYRPYSRKKWFGLERLYRPQLQDPLAEYSHNRHSSHVEQPLTCPKSATF